MLYPFHDLYTAGLYQTIAPQDAYKSPVNLKLAIHGALKNSPPVGYNTTFVYPVNGLNYLAQQLGEKCDLHYSKNVEKIDLEQKKLILTDGNHLNYRQLLSTLPLNQMLEITDLTVDSPAAPYTSVLVLNIGAKKGKNCPDAHWLYNPDAQSGFHRVGFYSNVDVYFLPQSVRENNSHVALYIERAYPGGQKPDQEAIAAYK